MLTNKEDIKAWLKEHEINNFTIDDNLIVNINQDFILNNFSKISIDEFPIQFGVINGSFEIANQNFSHFKNFPKIVKGKFNIYNNNFENLKGMPIFIKEDFVCGDNLFTSLDDLNCNIEGTLIHLSRIKNTPIHDFSHQYEMKESVLGQYHLLTLKKDMLNLIKEKNSLNNIFETVDNIQMSSKKLKI